MPKKILIIGAGPAGCSAAYCLSKFPSNDIEIHEISNRIGGMSRSETILGQIVDLGPHRFFSSDPRINKVWLEVVNREYKMVKRITRILYKRKWFGYPLQATDALIKLGLFTTIECLISYCKARLFPVRNVQNFEDWVTNKFGKKLYEIFFKAYTEKLWGISCEELSADFAKQRIKKFSLGEAIKSALGFNKENHKTLVDEFAYPFKGSGFVYEEMTRKSIENGVRLFRQSFIKEIRPITNDAKITYVCKFSNNSVAEFDTIISSMPLTNFIGLINNTPNEVLKSAQQLKFRNTILIYVEIDSRHLFDDQWVYVQDSNVKTGRITNFRNWVPELYKDKNTTVLALEYWCFNEDPIWQMESAGLYKVAVEDLKLCNITNQKSHILPDFDVIRIPKCYPVYSNDYQFHLDVIINYLDTLSGIYPVGRYGAFKYNNQDHSILMGILAAENILENSNHNLWDINTDYEYQESSKISETGLVYETKFAAHSTV